VQDVNKKLDKLTNILKAADLYKENTPVESTYESKIQGELIDLNTGKETESSDPLLNVNNFDVKTVAADSKLNQTIEPDKDLARIKFMPKYMAVYKVMEKGSMQKVILPVYGKGLWSTMYGFLALDKDLVTIEGFTFYEHGETPGLGGEIENPKWQHIWVGKKAFDENGDVAIQVIKGVVDQSKATAEYQVDGLSGATMTTNGVDKLVKFWMGDNGYGPFIKQLKKGGA
jgi:Na+-transporting NADH:ubiquinone oxidoreductase subunit C